jgi:hypothetical protein
MSGPRADPIGVRIGFAAAGAPPKLRDVGLYKEGEASLPTMRSLAVVLATIADAMDARPAV